MGSGDATGADDRVVVLAPTPRDADLSHIVLSEAGFSCVVCDDLPRACRAIEQGAGVAVLSEEFLFPEQVGPLADTLAGQPPWSDFPLVVLTRGGADPASAAWALEALGNVVLLERPVRVAALVSAVKAALRARHRQYQLREHLAQRQQAEEALREADKRKDEFLAMLGHELRNPLAPLANGL